MRWLSINAIEQKDTEKYTQMSLLKNTFITWIIKYREKQTWSRPAGLHLFLKRDSNTVVFLYIYTYTYTQAYTYTGFNQKVWEDDVLEEFGKIRT